MKCPIARGASPPAVPTAMNRSHPCAIDSSKKPPASAAPTPGWNTAMRSPSASNPNTGWTPCAASSSNSTGAPPSRSRSITWLKQQSSARSGTGSSPRTHSLYGWTTTYGVGSTSRIGGWPASVTKELPELGDRAGRRTGVRVRVRRPGEDLEAVDQPGAGAREERGGVNRIDGGVPARRRVGELGLAEKRVGLLLGFFEVVAAGHEDD